MNLEQDTPSASEMNKHLSRIDKALNSPWRAFLRGVFQGAGGIVGAAVIIFTIGIVLQIVGVIPALKDYAEEFKVILQDIRSR